MKLRRTAAALMAAVMTAGSITTAGNITTAYAGNVSTTGIMAQAGPASPSDMPGGENTGVLSGLKKNITKLLEDILHPDGFQDTVNVDDLEDLPIASASNMLMMKARVPEGQKPDPVETEDTKSKGVIIHLFDYDISSDNEYWGDRDINQGGGSPEGGINDPGYSPLKFYGQGGIPHGDDGNHNNYTGNSQARQGEVQNKLKNGYPVFDDGTEAGIPLDMLFKPENAHGKKVYKNLNHLFQLDEEGYYYLNSDENYVYYDPAQKNNGDFKVYDGSYEVEGDDDDGEGTMVPVGFYPLNDYDNTRTDVRPSDDVREDGSKGYYNHQHGLTMESEFYVPEDKKTENGDDLIFTFSGDDDIWIFVDDRLVLDMGGLHKPTHGVINFTTGEVTVEDGVVNWKSPHDTIGADSTLEEIFGQEFAAGTHTLKAFYMERGGVFSNLSIRTNIFWETPEDTVSFRITKKWADQEDSKDEKLAEEEPAEEQPAEEKPAQEPADEDEEGRTVTIHVLADGEVLEGQDITLSEASPTKEITLPRKSESGEDIVYTFEEEKIDGWYPFYTNKDGEPLEFTRTVWVKADSLEEAKDASAEETDSESEAGTEMEPGTGSEETSETEDSETAKEPRYLLVAGDQIMTGGSDDAVHAIQGVEILPEMEVDGTTYEDVIPDKGYKNYTWYFEKTPESDEGYEYYHDYWMAKQGEGEKARALALNSSNYQWYVTDKDGYKADEDAVYCNKLRINSADSTDEAEPDPEDIRFSTYFYWMDNNTHTRGDEQYYTYLKLDNGNAASVREDKTLWKKADWSECFDPETGEDGEQYILLTNNWGRSQGQNQLNYWWLFAPNANRDGLTTVPVPAFDENPGSPGEELPEGNYDSMAWTAAKIPTTDTGYSTYQGSWMFQADNGKYLSLRIPGQWQYWWGGRYPQWDDNGSTFTLSGVDGQTDEPAIYCNKMILTPPKPEWGWNEQTRQIHSFRMGGGSNQYLAFSGNNVSVMKQSIDNWGGSFHLYKKELSETKKQQATPFTLYKAVKYPVEQPMPTDWVVTNVPTGSLKVTKEVEGEAYGKPAFTFNITLLNEDGEPAEVNGTFSDVEFSAGTATILLGAGESKTIEGLPAIDYKVTEVKKTGFTVKGEAEQEDTIPAGTDPAEVTFTNIPDVTDVKVAKEWDDADDQDGLRPAEGRITVDLLANGEVYRTETFSGSFTFEDLPAYDDKGEKIQYTVSEAKVEGYDDPVVTGDAETGYTITNRHTPETLAIQVTKVWNDAEDQDGYRLSAEEFGKVLHLWKSVDGGAKEEVKDAVPEVTVTGEETGAGYKIIYSGLAKYQEGKEIAYTVSEDVPEHYTADKTEAADGESITNTHEPETTEVSGKKIWDDADDQDGIRPAKITVRLLADGTEIDHREITDSYSFKDLPKNKAGKEIKYTVTEDEVKGYTTTYDGFDITNTHTPEETSVKVTKQWDDADNQDGLRPETVKVTLLADGKAAAEAEFKDSYVFEGLPVNKAGKKIIYTVSETPVKGYDAAVTGSAKEGFAITNKHVPDTTSIDVTKVWDDGSDKDRIRPASVRVKLLADGLDAKAAGSAIAGLADDEAVLSAENSWKHTWNNLPVYRKGSTVKIVYTVAEETVPTGYTVKVSGDAAAGFTIVNTHLTPEPTPEPPTPGGGGGSGSGGTPHWPGFPTNPTTPTGVLGEQRLPDFVSQVLGSYREPSGVLGAARMGDDAALAFAGTGMLLAALGMLLMLFKKKKKES